MKTLLDLIQEFAGLDDAKTLAGGVLPPAEEKRWQELKDFYDTLMMQEGFREDPVARFSADEIRRHISNRMRLRVRTDMEVVVQHQSDFTSARIGNLSCGGALLLCDSQFEIGAPLTLHLTRIQRREGIIWVEGKVVWHSNGGAEQSAPRHRMGVRFVGLEKDEQTQLDSYVVETIENRILSLRAEALSPDFVRRERLTL
jgi:Tfp pilus assembly protein PilZ